MKLCCRGKESTKESITDQLLTMAALANREHMTLVELEVRESDFNILGRPSFVVTPYGNVNIRTRSDG